MAFEDTGRAALQQTQSHNKELAITIEELVQRKKKGHQTSEGLLNLPRFLC